MKPNREERLRRAYRGRAAALAEMWTALAEISDLFEGHGWEDADADELRADVERVVEIVNQVLPRSEIEAAQEASNDA